MNSNDSNKLQYNVGDLVYWNEGNLWSYGIICDNVCDIDEHGSSNHLFKVYWFDVKGFEWNGLSEYDITNISQQQRKKNETQ